MSEEDSKDSEEEHLHSRHHRCAPARDSDEESDEEVSPVRQHFLDEVADVAPSATPRPAKKAGRKIKELEETVHRSVKKAPKLTKLAKKEK